MKSNKWLLVLGVLIAGVAAAYSVFSHAGWKQVKLVSPSGVAVDKVGNVYIADSNNYTIDKLTPDGQLSILAGSPGRYGAMGGKGRQARFYGPSGIAVGPDDSIFVSDLINQMIYKITPDGMTTILAGAPWKLSFPELKEHLDSNKPALKGFADGGGTEARFSIPRGIAVDSAGNVYVADQGNDIIRKITPDGMVSTFAGKPSELGHNDGMGAAARFSSPAGIAVDGAGNVYVADTGNGIIRKITPDGMVTTLFGKAGDHGYIDGAGATARLGAVFSIAADSTGNLYVINADSLDAGWLLKITPDGAVSKPGSRYGSAVAVDGAGDMYLLSRGIEKISHSGGSLFLLKETRYHDGPIALLIDYLPDGWAALAVIAAAFANMVLLAIALALAVNRFAQLAWKAALKTPPPAVSNSLAALAVALLMAAFIHYSYWSISDYYGLNGIMMPSFTEIAMRYGLILQLVPLLILILFFVLIKSARRERYFAGILGGVTVLAFMVVGSMFWPIFLHYTGTD